MQNLLRSKFLKRQRISGLLSEKQTAPLGLQPGYLMGKSTMSLILSLQMKLLKEKRLS